MTSDQSSCPHYSCCWDLWRGGNDRCAHVSPWRLLWSMKCIMIWIFKISRCRVICGLVVWDFCFRPRQQLRNAHAVTLAHWRVLDWLDKPQGGFCSCDVPSRSYQIPWLPDPWKRVSSTCWEKPSVGSLSVYSPLAALCCAHRDVVSDLFLLLVCLYCVGSPVSVTPAGDPESYRCARFKLLCHFLFAKYHISFH